MTFIASGKPGLQEGAILKAKWGDKGLGVARITGVDNHIPSLSLVRLSKPVKAKGKACEWLVVRNWNHRETREIYKKEPVCLIGGSKEQAERAFAVINKRFAEYLAGGTAEVICGEELRAEKAQFKVLSQMMPESVKAALAGDTETQATFEAESAIATISGKPNSPSALAKYRAWRRRSSKVDIVKKDLALNWTKKGYQDMRGADLSAAVEKATGISLNIKTIRSLCNELDLTSSDNVRPGPACKA